MTSEFGRVLVDQFYDEYQKDVIHYVFIPYGLYFLSTICYMSSFMISRQTEASEATREEVISSVKESKALGMMILEFSNLVLTVFGIAYSSVIEGL